MEETTQKIKDDETKVSDITPVAEDSQVEADLSDPVKTPKRKKIIVISVLTVLAVALVGGGIAFATSQQHTPEPAKEQPTQAAAQPEAIKKSEVKATIKAEAAAGTALTKAKVAVFDQDGKQAVVETEVAANEAVSLGELSQGDYELYVTAAPVAEDGSTYKLPDEPEKFTVSDTGNAVKVEVNLEVLDAEDMSKEQLEVASSVLEAAGKTEAARSTKAAAQQAPSVPGSADSVQRPVAPSGGNSGGSNKPSGGDSGSGSGGGVETPSTPSVPDPVQPSNPTVPEPEPPAPVEPSHTCTFAPIKETVWVADGSMVPDYDHPRRVYYCSDCGIDFASADACLSHDINHNTGSRTDYPMVPSGSWQSQTVGWNSCPTCGASK